MNRCNSISLLNRENMVLVSTSHTMEVAQCATLSQWFPPDATTQLVSGPLFLLLLTNFHGEWLWIETGSHKRTWLISWKPPSRGWTTMESWESWGIAASIPWFFDLCLICKVFQNPAALLWPSVKKTRLINGLRLPNMPGKHSPCWSSNDVGIVWILNRKTEIWFGGCDFFWAAIGGRWGFSLLCRKLFSLVCNRWQCICLLAGRQETVTCRNPTKTCSFRKVWR